MISKRNAPDYFVKLKPAQLWEFKQGCVSRMKASGQLRMWKEGEQWFVWCDRCQRYEPVDQLTRQDVEASYVCPMCFREAYGLKKQRRVDCHNYFRLEDSYGYEVKWHWEAGKIMVDGAYQVAYWDGDEYVRDIVIGMGYGLGHYWDKERTGWRYVRPGWYSCHKYYGYFWDADSTDEDPEAVAWEQMVYSKRSYYESITTTNAITLKSDQRKFISQGLYSLKQLRFIQVFDLHSRKQVRKYRGYINKFVCRPDDDKRGWNVYTLDYLWRNKIPLHDFRDYENMCKQLGRKPDKPKDFQHWHDEVAKMVEIKKNKKVSLQIAKRAKKLPSFEKKNATIKPIGSFEELTNVSKTLHNCIRTYAARYAEGMTDLFCLIVGGKLVGAIEVRDKRLIQARADHNGDLPPIAMKQVHQFCTEIGATWK